VLALVYAGPLEAYNSAPLPIKNKATGTIMQIIEEALTFDDVLLVPAHSHVMPKDVDLSTRVTRDIELKVPMLSAAMDTVTEARLSIALAQEGGMGIIHKNMTAEEQAEQVNRVKKHESGVITDPVQVSPDMSVREVIELREHYKISGVPVIQGDDLVGLVTSRDVRFETNLDQPVSAVMTPKDKLVTVREGASKEEVLGLLHKHRIERVLVVNDKFQLRGMITVKDIQKSTDFPNASKDADGRLRVGAAVSTGEGTEQRVELLAGAGVDVIVVDTAHGHSQAVLDRVKWVKDNFGIQVIGGNIATGEAAKALMDAGADGVKVGIGPGSICTTRIISGVGVPQITAINNVAVALEGTGIPLIADGGIRYSGDMAKAIAAGGYCIMVGSMLAGTEEAPGEEILYQGRSYKSYRGMGSLGAMKKGSSDRYFQDTLEGSDKLVPEGIEGRVAYKGPLSAIVHQMVGGLRSSMGYVGCATLDEMRTKPRFVRISGAGMSESHVHDVTITKEAPNYRSS
jgi:IMP dehydrogenase